MARAFDLVALPPSAGSLPAPTTNQFADDADEDGDGAITVVTP
jgi:hypothetical protein